MEKTLPSPRRKPPPPPLCIPRVLPAPLTHLPSAPVEVREPPARPECAPAAHTTRSSPRAAAAAAEIKEKETKHHGKRSSPFKAPKTRQAHASLPLHSRVGGRRAKGEGSPFFPSTCTPSFRTPKVLLEPKDQWWKRKGDSFPARSPLPLNCTRVLGFSRVPPAPSPPTQPVNSPHQICPNEGSPLRLRTPARAIPGHPGTGSGPRPPLAGGARADPAPATPLPVPPQAPHHTPWAARATRALRGPSASAAFRGKPEEEEKWEAAFRKLIGAARARLTQSAPGQHDAGPPADLPPLEERSVPSALCPTLYPWEKPAPLPLIAQGKSPPPPTRPAQELGNGTPTPPKRKPHRVPVTHGPSAVGIFPSFPRAEVF